MVDEKTKGATIRRELVVDVGQQRAFNVFTAEFGQWWPLLSHHIGQAAPEVASSIVETADRTGVVLEHRHLDRYGVDADKMRGIFDSDGGWTGILQRFAARNSRTNGSRGPCVLT